MSNHSRSVRFTPWMRESDQLELHSRTYKSNPTRSEVEISSSMKQLLEDESRNVYIDCGHLSSTSPFPNVIDKNSPCPLTSRTQLKSNLKTRNSLNRDEPNRKITRLDWESSSHSEFKSTSSPELPPTPPSPLFGKTFTKKGIFPESPGSFDKNLNYSSNYQTVFDLPTEGEDVYFKHQASKGTDADLQAPAAKRERISESFVSSGSGISAATSTTICGQHLITTPTCRFTSQTHVVNPGNTSLITEPGSPQSAYKRRSLVDILISPGKKKFHFTFGGNHFCKLHKSNSTNIYISQGGFSFPSTPLGSRTAKERLSLKSPKKTKFISTFFDPEPESFFLKMKLKEKIRIKPRSQSTSSRGTKRSTDEFSDVHFTGRGSKARELDHEDDGGFSQYQQLQQSFFISRRHQDSPDCGGDHVHHSTDGGHDCAVCGVPMATLTRRVKSVVEKPGSSSKGGRDHSDCAKCNRAQPDSFQTVPLPHDHPEHRKRAPSEDWGLNADPSRSALSKDGRHRFVSESNLFGPLRPVPLGYSPSVQNVFTPNTPGGLMPIGSSHGPGMGRSPGYDAVFGPDNNQRVTGPGVSPGYGFGVGTLPASAGTGSLMRPAGNSFYVQCGTEVKKVNLPSGDENPDRSDGSTAPNMNSMRELHGLVAAAFPIAVTEDDFLHKKKIVYIKDEASGIYYELEDIGDVKPRCFLSIRDYKAPNLPIYDRADSSSVVGPGQRGLSRSTAESPTTPFSPSTVGGKPNSRPPLKLSVFQPNQGQNSRAGLSKNQALPYPASGSQPVGLDQIDRSSSFSQTKASEPLNRSATGNSGVQTLGRNFSWTDNLKAMNSQHSIGGSGYNDKKGSNQFPGASNEMNKINGASSERPLNDFVDEAINGTEDSNFLMSRGGNQNEDGFRSESDALQMTSSNYYNRRYAADKENIVQLPNSKLFSNSDSRNVQSSESTNVTTCEVIDKSSTIIIRDGYASANDSNVNANIKLDHIEVQLGDLTHLVNTLLMKQHEKDSTMRSGSEKLMEIDSNKENEGEDKGGSAETDSKKPTTSELATLEQLKHLFQQQLTQVNSSKSNNVNLMQHHQFISSAKEDNLIAFDQLCALREKVRHLRLELNQLKRAHANHVTNGQLMIREASQRITSAIDVFAQHSKKEEEARSKRTAALSQAWALHLATLDKLESEIGEMELMVEKIKSDAEHYNKHGHLGQFEEHGANFKAIWDRRIEQLTQSVQDTGLLISKVKVDLLEFETQLAELVRLGGAVGDSQRKLMKDGPERLAGFIERIRTLSHHLTALKEIEFNAREIDLSLNRPQSTPPELPMLADRNLLLSPAAERSGGSVFEDSFGHKSSSVFSSFSHKHVDTNNRSPVNYNPSFIASSTKSRSYATLNGDDKLKTTTSSTLNCITGGHGLGQVKDDFSYQELITDLDTTSSLPSPPVNLTVDSPTNLLSQQQTVVKKRSANQVKKKRSDGSASRERSDSSASILDTAYVTDTDDLEVIRNKTNMSMASTKNVTRTSRVSTSRHRSTNREVLIDDYYSTVEQLQKSNRDISKTRVGDREQQRCRTDLLVTQQATPNEASQSLPKTPSVRSLSPASTAGGGNKQVTTYTYYTITKDGQKKTVYGGKQQKLVGTTELENS